MNDIVIPNVQITLGTDDYNVFRELFAYGFKVKITTGSSLLALLSRELGISKAYLNQRVQTIFLDGKAVDDISRELVKDKSVIALSAAMPGVVGAVFRKGGVLSPMRSGFESDSQLMVRSKQPGFVTLKLFNLVASELGGDFLKKGIRLSGDHFVRYVNWKQSQLKSVCRRVVINGADFGIDDILSVCEKDGDILLSVNFDG